MSRARMALGALIAVTVGLLVLGGGISRSAFTGSITNSADKIALGGFTCQAAELADKPLRMYSLASTNGGTNQGSAGTGTNATFVGNVLGNAFATGGGCKRDSQSYFSGTPAILGLLARWVSTAGTTTISANSVLTQEVWVNSTSTQGLIMGFGNSGTAADGSTIKGLQLFFTSTGRIDFATYNGANTELLSPAGTNLANGVWHQVVAVYNAGSKQLYVDGALVASGTGPTQTLSGMYWRLGNDSLSGWSNAPSGATSTYLNGGLQFAAVYPAALTAAQVNAHYRAGVG